MKEVSKDEVLKFLDENKVCDVRVKVMTNPKNTKIGKKKPEILDLKISGEPKDVVEFVFSKKGKVVNLSDVFQGGELIDCHGITKGKGFQGAVKRFGVKLTSHKSEKKRRHAGNVGAWTPTRVSHTIPLPGQLGYNRRCEFNKWVLYVSKNPDEINKKEGLNRYGNVQNEFLLIKGSVVGPKKRLITFVRTIRGNKRYPKIAPEIKNIIR